MYTELELGVREGFRNLALLNSEVALWPGRLHERWCFVIAGGNPWGNTTVYPCTCIIIITLRAFSSARFHATRSCTGRSIARGRLVVYSRSVATLFMTLYQAGDVVD